MSNAPTTHSPTPIAALTLLSWLGMAVHNAVELPDLPFYRPEYLFPSLLSLLLFLGWWKMPARRKLWGWLLFGWAGVHWVGGAVMSIIPLSIWPFIPEQSGRSSQSSLPDTTCPT